MEDSGRKEIFLISKLVQYCEIEIHDFFRNTSIRFDISVFKKARCIKHSLSLASVLCLATFQSGCSTTAQEVALGAAVGTSILSSIPANELEQIYYLGTFDPRGQLPPTIYRVRVHGQASAFSNVSFASGWVPAGVIDSLSSNVGFKNGAINITGKEKENSVGLDLHRRLMQFGPEGFREAPANHRLVIVMGADPSNYFQGIDMALGQISEFDSQKSGNELKIQLMQQLTELQEAELDLAGLEHNIAITEKDLD